MSQCPMTSPDSTRQTHIEQSNRLMNLAVRYDKVDKNRLKGVELPDAAKRSRIAEPQLERLRCVKGEAIGDLWRIILVAVNTGLREGKLLEIKRSWIRKEADGYWLVLPPSASRLKGNPAEIPLNKTAVKALMDESQTSVMSGSFDGRTSGPSRSTGTLPAAGRRWSICIFTTSVIRSRPACNASASTMSYGRRSLAIGCLG